MFVELFIRGASFYDMTLAEITNIALTILGTIYVPYWIYQQTVKNKTAKDIVSEVTNIKILLAEKTTEHSVMLRSHEKRITRLEDERKE